MTRPKKSGAIAQSVPITVGILLFPEVEVLDFAGPFEVFSVAGRVGARRASPGAPPFRVVTIAAIKAPVVARHGLEVRPQHEFSDAPPIDVLIVPGGVVAEPLSSEPTLDWVRQTADRATVTASVCTGAFILAQVGLLDGLTATTHWEDIDELRRTYPLITIIDDVPYVDEGAVITSAGISAGIAMSLHLVRRLCGEELARLTARQMQYDWELGGEDIPKKPQIARHRTADEGDQRGRYRD